MSFGVVQSMISSLKNNKRDRKSALKRLKENPAEYSDGNELHFEKKATPMQLKKIREDLQKENRKIKVRNITIVVIFMLALIYFIGFAKF